MWGNFYVQQFRLADEDNSTEVVVLYSHSEPNWLGHLVATDCRTKESVTITNAHRVPDITTTDSWDTVCDFNEDFTTSGKCSTTVEFALPLIANEFRKAVFDHRFMWPQPTPKFCESFDVKRFREQLTKID